MPRDLLVVDDEPKICSVLKTFFEERGFRVSVATTAADALEQLDRLPPDAVLLDLRLPDQSGIEVLSQIKARSPNLRVIVISALSDPQTIHEAFDRGASDYLTKPLDFSRCFYAAMGIDVVDVNTVQAEPEALKRMPGSIAEQYRAIPVRLRDKTLELAMADPLAVQQVDELKALLGCEIKVLAAVGGEVVDAVRRCYGMGAAVQRLTRPSAEPPRQRDVSPLNAEEGATGITRLVNDLIQHAAADRATDLHLGIDAQGPWVRERIDGLLYDVPLAEQFGELYSSVISRIKVMASLDIAERRVPQDGRICLPVGSTTLDLRISVVPTPRGEHLAIRLLETSRIYRLEQLGLSEEQHQQLMPILSKPTGLLLVTGPTGSGKSTSLYAFLSLLNTGRVTIVTLEDPIEHELPGITQIQVQPKIGLTFATGLRSMLRHDPDIIMVGEIRDQETASLAVRAALTGHVVLATLHTNDAASGITRLVDLGIEPFLLCSTLSGILSQRLLRLLCERCREASDVEIDASVLTPLGLAAPARTGTVRLGHARGCADCRRSGYHGRIGVFELLVVDHHIRSLILRRTASAQIRQSALSRGMTSLWQCGWRQAQAGLTSLEELLRVLSPDLR